jgi:DnaJ family protein A protein 2
VIFILQETKHEFFERDGESLIMQKTVPLANALTGFSFELQHLDGKKVIIETPPGMIIQPDSVLEVADQGMPVYNYPFEFGSLFVKFHVAFPTQLATEQIEQLRICLPDLQPTPIANESTVKVQLQAVNRERKRERAQRDNRNAYDSDSGEEGGGHRGGVQCAQQ